MAPMSLYYKTASRLRSQNPCHDTVDDPPDSKCLSAEFTVANDLKTVTFPFTGRFLQQKWDRFTAQRRFVKNSGFGVTWPVGHAV